MHARLAEALEILLEVALYFQGLCQWQVCCLRITCAAIERQLKMLFEALQDTHGSANPT